MTPHCRSARSAVTRFRPNLHHPHFYVLLLLVVTALVVTLGIRPAAPDATATTGKTFETDDHVVTQTPDGTVTIIDKKTQIAVQDTVDQSATGPTEKELAAQANGLSQQFKKNLGWDLEIDADRTRLLNETRALTQQLHNIPQATLDLKENAALRTLRDIVDKMDGTKNCRERCLTIISAQTMIAGASLAVSLEMLKSHLASGGSLQADQAVLAIIFIAGPLFIFWSRLEHDLHNIPDNFKWIIHLVMAGIIRIAQRAFNDLVDYVVHSRATMRQEVTDAAQHIDTLTPDDEPATDYDLAKDEL